MSSTDDSESTSPGRGPPPVTSDTLVGARIAVTGNRRGPELAATLRRRGAEVLLGPTLLGDIPAPDDEVVADTRAILSADPAWVVATTAVGMRVWVDIADRAGLGRQLRSMASDARCVARGAKAVGGLARLDATADWVSPSNTDGDLVSWLRTRIVPGDAVAVQLHGGVSRAYDTLADVGADVLTVVPYHWELPSDPAPARAVVRAAAAGDLDLVTFTSAGAVANLFQIAADLGDDVAGQLRRALAGPVAVASVGPVTAEAVEAHGGTNTVVPRRWRTAAMVRGVEAWWARRDDVATDLGLQLHPDRSAVEVGGRVLVLGPREYAVLAALSRRPGVLVRAEELAVEGWGHEAPDHAGAVKHQVSRLRRKLADTGVRIETVRGAGYRMAVSS